jgi:tetratricopeptide (TPR) repeat protein
MKKTVFVLMLTLCLVGRSFACLNGEVLELINGSVLYVDSRDATPRGHNFASFHDRKYLLKAVVELDSLYRVNNDIRYLSDEGLALIVLGEYKKAIFLYQEIEMTEPDRYSTASNIGTAYELDGQNKQALFWIEKAVKLNEHSHYDSEWIHVNILKAKLGGDELITTKFLLNTDFGTDNIPHTALPKKKLDSISAALFYQLNERISFVKPKDKIVAQLLFDLGNLTFVRSAYKVALDDYALAKKYGYDDKLIDQRIKAALNYSKNNKTIHLPNNISEKKNPVIYICIGFCMLLTVFLAALIWRRKYKRIADLG